jgi:HD-like signal output (HDOD) protein
MPPTLALDASATQQDAHVTLDFLMRRMRQKTDFPALGASITRIQSLSTSETENLHTLSEEILKDVALTQKLLRVVNAARYRDAGMDPISTVSRAVTLVGMAGIRNVALSLMLVEHMDDKQHARQLKEEFLRTVMSGTVASELCANARRAEEAFVAALFRSLGRLLVEYYLPEDATQVRDLIKASMGALSDEDASVRVMGMGFESLGQAVGEEWGLPTEILGHMRAPQGRMPSKPMGPTPEQLSWLASLACEISRTMLLSEPTELGSKFSALESQYATPLALARGEINDAAFRARKKLSELASALEMHVPQGDPAERLLDSFYEDVPSPEANQMASVDELGLGTEHNDFGDLDLDLMLDVGHDPVRILNSGIQDVANTLADDFKLTEVLQMILETVLRAFECHRVVLCLRDVKSGQLVGRIALGEGAESIRPLFNIPLDSGQGPPHLFSAACMKGVDTLIKNAAQDNIVNRLPVWFRDRVQAPTFLLLPLVMKRQGVETVMGMIYADKMRADSLQVDQHQLSLLNTLRKQAIMAFKQASSSR